jgi:hypothetical protein
MVKRIVFPVLIVSIFIFASIIKISAQEEDKQLKVKIPSKLTVEEEGGTQTLKSEKSILTGRVKKIDVKNKFLLVEGPNNTGGNFEVYEKTKYKGVKGLKGFRVGDEVKVEYSASISSRPIKTDKDGGVYLQDLSGGLELKLLADSVEILSGRNPKAISK